MRRGAICVAACFVTISTSYASSRVRNSALFRTNGEIEERSNHRRLFGIELYRDVWFDDAQVCYGSSNSSFDVYTLTAGIDEKYRDAFVRNTLRWTRRHDARFCVWHRKLDATRTGSWNKIAMLVESMACSKAKWALTLDADAVLQNMDLGPSEILSRIEASVGSNTFASRSVFLSDDFGKDAKKNKINAGVFFVRINKESVNYLEKVWNEYHGMSLFYKPPREEQAAMRRFLERDAVEFEKYAVIVPYRVFNNYHKTAEQDDFLRHYAGYGSGRGKTKSQSKYDSILAEISGETSSGDVPRALNHVEKSVRGAYTRFARMSFPVKILLMAFPTRMRMAEMNSCCDRANADDGRLTPSIEIF